MAKEIRKYGGSMNVELLEKVKQHILAEPRRFMMSDFIDLASEDREDFMDYDAPECGYVKFAKCGTAACIGGWAVILNGITPQVADNLPRIAEVAEEALGITRVHSDRLFHVDNWPYEFRRPYEGSDTPAQKAKVAAERIDHFIKTNGAE